MNNFIKSKYFIGLLALVLGLSLGSMFFGSADENQERKKANLAISKEEIWTCSMHAQIKQSEEGQCPICGMDLIPMLENTDNNDDPLSISMSPSAMNLANIQTSVVERKIPIKWLRVNGKVTVDEREVYSQTSHLSGRVEVLKVNYTGEFVSKGQVLAKIYSPQLEVAQEELLEANKSKSEFPEMFEAAKSKLRNWKLTENQIEAIIKNKESSGYFPIMADVSGVVAEKMINEGAYIKEGQTLFKVTDLSKAWVLFDIYESDINWVKKGDKVEFSLLSFPGKTLNGVVSFMDPILNAKTRVAKARLEFDNSDVTERTIKFTHNDSMARFMGLSRNPESVKSTFILSSSSYMYLTRMASIEYNNKSQYCLNNWTSISLQIFSFLTATINSLKAKSTIL